MGSHEFLLSLRWGDGVVSGERAGGAGVVPVAPMPDERLRAERVSGVRRKQRERRVRSVALQGIGKGGGGARAWRRCHRAAGMAHPKRTDRYPTLARHRFDPCYDPDSVRFGGLAQY